eukprot:2400634-Rhodomonas_salina.1
MDSSHCDSHVTQLRRGGIGDRGGNVPYLLPAGSKRARDVAQGPSAGLLKATRRSCFAPSIPELGQSPIH